MKPIIIKNDEMSVRGMSKKKLYDFPYEPGHLVENKANKDFNDQHNQDTPGFSLRFYVFLTVGFALVIATVLWFAPEIDHNPIFALLLLIFVSVGLWFAIDQQAKKARKKSLRL